MNEEASTTITTLERDRLNSRASILRVFNYYRLFLSFALLLIFLRPIGEPLVGAVDPALFHWSIIGYIGFNVLATVLFSLMSKVAVGKTAVAFTSLTIDVMFLCLFVYTSGGVASGIGNLLVFPVAFAGVLIVGRLSVTVAAIAVILTMYGELHHMFSWGGLQSELLFGAGLLGIVLFVVNILFQYLSSQLAKKESKIVTLEELNDALTAAELARSEAFEANRRFEVLVRSAGEGVLGVDLDGKITFANPKACELLEATEKSLIGRNIAFFSRLTVDGDAADTGAFVASDLLRRLQALARSPASENRWMTAKEQIFDVDFTCEATLGHNDDPVGGVIIFQDVSDRKAVERKLNYMANYDGLTDLVNRTYFQTALEKAIARACRSDANVAVFLLDVDHFKYVNDRYGHNVGDQLLSEISKRLIKCVRKGDTVARLGGDEFAILLLDFHAVDNLVVIANNVIDQVNRPFQLGDVTLNISTSIGIGMLDHPEMSPNELLRTADTAMYVAKGSGRNTYRFFQPEMQSRAEEKQRLQIALQNALKHDEFKLVYQPIFDLKDRTLHHSEALIRWLPADGQLISPDVFIPLAEESGRIADIGDWVLSRAVQQLTDWKMHLGECPRIAINVSSKQLANSRFRETIEKHLTHGTLPEDSIELELTETGVMDDPEQVMSELVKLSQMGISVSIDDFGTGYSSLDYLRRLPINQIKIDKSFVQGIGRSQHDEEIIRVIIAVAHTMNVRVIAEGIETEDQASFLIGCGSDYGQGYLFSKPLDALTIVDLFRQGAARSAEAQPAI